MFVCVYVCGVCVCVFCLSGFVCLFFDECVRVCLIGFLGM